MSDVKKNKNRLKISRDKATPDESRISFSFRYLTTNSKFNFDYFSSSQLRDKVVAYDAFLDVMEFLSSKTKLDIIKMSRKDDGGSEKLPINSINFLPSGDCRESLEEVRSIRFGKGKYRLIGFWHNQSFVFCVIGFDFNFSAYNHG